MINFHFKNNNLTKPDLFQQPIQETFSLANYICWTILMSL